MISAFQLSQQWKRGHDLFIEQLKNVTRIDVTIKVVPKLQ